MQALIGFRRFCMMLEWFGGIFRVQWHACLRLGQRIVEKSLACMDELPLILITKCLKRLVVIINGHFPP